MNLLRILPIIFCLLILVGFVITERKLLAVSHFRQRGEHMMTRGVILPLYDALKFYVTRHQKVTITVVTTINNYLFFTTVFLFFLKIFIVFLLGLGESGMFRKDIIRFFILVFLVYFTYTSYGVSSGRKYAQLSYHRRLLQYLRYEIVTFLFILVGFFTRSYLYISGWGLSNGWVGSTGGGRFMVMGMLTVYFFFFLLLCGECFRSPFDNIEAESEVVTGIICELEGAVLSLFLLSEYASLIGSSILLIFTRLGCTFWQFLFTGVVIFLCRSWRERYKWYNITIIFWKIIFFWGLVRASLLSILFLSF